MKLTQASSTRLVFQLSHREERALRELLRLYPCTPPAHHVLSKSGRVPDRVANQQLLDEALAEQRAATGKQLQALLADPRRFAHTETGARLSLSRGEADWLLQVLNDIRVGSWVRLGSPEEKPTELTATNTPHFLAMEMAGYFQMQVLKGMAGERGG
jgi:hypothetical protein